MYVFEKRLGFTPFHLHHIKLFTGTLGMRLSCDSQMNFSFYQSFIVIFQPHQPLCFKMACGGLGEQKKADSEVQQICNQVSFSIFRDVIDFIFE